MSAAPLVSVVTLSYNGRHHLAECLPPLLAAAAASGVSCEILVVDNGSTDGTAAWLGDSYPAARHPHLRLLRTETNLGFTGGNNMAARQARGRHLVFVNNDTRAEAGWLGALAAAMEAAPADVGAVSGRILDWEGGRIDFIEGVVTFDGHAFQRHFGRRVGSVAEPAAGSELLFPCGGNMIVRRDLFLELGGFDDAFFAYLEDVDLGWRLWIAGHRVLFAPDAVVRHRSSATGILLGLYNRGFLIERNAFMVAYKNFGDAALAALSPAIFCTLLNRAQTLLGERSRGGEALARDPVAGRGGVANAPPRPVPLTLGAKLRAYSARQFLQRAALKLAGMPRPPQGDWLAVEDPHAIMQLQAHAYLLAHRDELAAARAAVQRLRRRPDEEIQARFPLHLVPTYPGDEALFASRFFRDLLPQAFPLRETTLGEIMEMG